jgi:hypothetical protein
MTAMGSLAEWFNAKSTNFSTKINNNRKERLHVENRSGCSY